MATFEPLWIEADENLNGESIDPLLAYRVIPFCRAGPKVARHLLEAGQYTVEAIAETLGIKRKTVYGHLGYLDTGSQSVDQRAQGRVCGCCAD